MTSERVQVDPSEIKVGDLIEVETPEGQSGAVMIRRDVVTEVGKNSVVTTVYSFARHYDNSTNRTYYRLPKPAPEEPKGLGAVVELTNEDGEPRLIVRVYDLWQDEDGDEMGWENWMTYASNQAKVLSDGYVA